MTEYKMTLSTTEPNNYVGLIKLRQGDKDSQVLNVTVTENGKLFKFDGLSVFFNSVLPNGTVVRDKVQTIDYTNSKLTYKVIDSFLQEVAAISAWFSFESGDKTVDSTKNFRYIVEAGWQSCITQGNYIYELSEIQREIEEIISNKDFTPLISRIDDLENDITAQLAHTETQIGNLSALGSNPQNLSKTISEREINVRDYGAVGDGTTDDTAAIQFVFNNAQPKAKIILPYGYTFKVSEVIFNVREATLTGGGAFSGTLFVGAKTGGENNLNAKVDNIVFEYASLQSGTKGIELGKVRVLTITRCLFKNVDKAVYVAPVQGYSFHDISQIKIFHNQFQAVNYNVFIELYDDFSTNTNRWMTCSDWQYIDNISNITVISPIWLKAIDGINISNNTFFHSSLSNLRGLKEKGIYIGTSDWVNIVSNHIFETGFEAIHLENPRHYVISNNEIAWCGQREPKSSIRTTGANIENGVITDNNISLFTLHGVSIETTGQGAVSVKENVMDYLHTNNTYFGSTPLDSITHYTVNQIRSTNVTVNENGNELNSPIHLTSNIKRRYGGSYKTTRRSHMAGTFVTQSFSTVQTTYNIVEFENMSGSKIAYDGLLYINARELDLDDSNTASYILHVSKAKGNAHCYKISEAGLTSGGSANHPSFTFTIDEANNLLKATGIGSTKGTFVFYISYIGNIELIK